MKKVVFALTLSLLTLQNLNAQNVGINETGASPSSSAILDVQSLDKGLLIPRTDTSSITVTSTGLLIYQISDERFYYYNGSHWVGLASVLENGAFENVGTLIRQKADYNDDFMVGRADVPLNGQSVSDRFMLFDNSKAAFRGGRLSVSKNWGPDSIGDYSLGFGFNTKAKGTASVALGVNTEALGSQSLAMGANTKAYSAYEIVFGNYNTPYTPNSMTSWNNNDRLFVLGNGFFSASDALVVLKNGNTSINGTLTLSDGNSAYTLPNVDGLDDQILATDGSGNLNWINQSTSVFSTDQILDNDGTTRITSEENINEDLLRFYIDDNEIMKLDEKTLSLNSPGSSMFIGVDAGMNDDGSSNQNTFLGYHSGRNNTSGFGNTMTGYYAGRGNQSGDYNTHVGWVAGTNLNNGDANTFLGARAGYLNSSGSENTTIGKDASYANQIGIQNTILGVEAGYKVKGSGNLMLGYKAGREYIGSSKLFIDNSPTTTPLIWGDFQNDIVKINGSLGIGNAYSFPVTDGQYGQVLRTDGFGQLSWTYAPSVNKIEDADGNTKIQVEESANEDVIRFDIGGEEVAVWDENTFGLKTIHIGENAGLGQGETSNIFIGYNSGKHSGAAQNTAIGYLAMEHANTNYDNHENVAVGYRSMNYAGEQSTAIGSESLVAGGLNCTAVGFKALQYGGKESVAVGHRALESYESIYCTAVGANALYPNSGSWNSAFGKDALKRNQTGWNNTAVGGNTLGGNIIGYENVAVGINALTNILANNANYNTGVGGKTLKDNETGNNNTALGYFANVSSPNLDNSTVIGSYATVDCSNCLVLDTDADVGIRNSNPETDLHVKHQNGLSGENGFRLENESNGSYFRFYADGAESLLVYSNYSPTASIASVDYISGHWLGISDMRHKKNRSSLQSVLSDVLKLKPEHYNFLNQNEGDKKYLGFMAQDVKEFFPSLVSYQEESDVYTMDYAGFGVIAIKAIQELNDKVESQEKTILKQNKLLEDLVKRLEVLEQEK